MPVANWFRHYLIPRSSYDEVLSWEEADAVLVTPVRHTGSPAICSLLGTPRSLEISGYPDQTSDPTSEGGEVETEDIGATLSQKHRDNEDEDNVREEGEEARSFSAEFSSEEEENAQRERKEDVSEEQTTTQEDISESARELSEEGSSQDDSADGELRGNSAAAAAAEGSSSSEELEHDTEIGEEDKPKRVDPTDGGVEDAAQNASGQRPFFMFQRRKFVFKEVENGDGGRCDGEKTESFGLVELPVGWQLGR